MSVDSRGTQTLGREHAVAMTPEYRLEQLQKRALREVRSTARDVSRMLVNIRNEADEALKAIRAGHRMYGQSQNGPVDTQAQANLLRYTVLFNGAIEIALNVGCEPGAIDDAARQGANDGF